MATSLENDIPSQHIRAITSHLSALVKHYSDELALRSATAPQDLVDKAKRILRLNQRVNARFGYRMGAMPGVIMLLDLFIAEHSRRRISVSSLSLAPGVPPTTGLRWVRLLQRKGLIVRHANPGDRRVAWFDLSDRGRGEIEALLSLWE